MTKNISQIAVFGLLAAALVALPVGARAEGTNAPASPGQTAQPKLKKLGAPFHGKLAAVDAKAMTLTVGTLVMHVTPDTKITKDGQPAALKDGEVGKPVGGAYLKVEDGTLNATVVHFGAKHGTEPGTQPGDKTKVPLDTGNKQ